MSKWTDEITDELKSIVGDDEPVTAATVEAAADALGFTTRSVASKLRKIGYTVESMAKAHAPTFTEGEAEKLRAFVESNAGKFTYEEIAEHVFGNGDLKRKVQGKILSMELTDSVKPTEKVEVQKVYTDAEEAKFIELANNGAFLEDIASALNKPLNSVRGKALSLRDKLVNGIPKQRDSYAKVDSADALEALGDVSDLTVETIADKIGKSERGVKTMLTHRGVTAKDYDGAARKAKIAERNAA